MKSGFLCHKGREFRNCGQSIKQLFDALFHLRKPVKQIDIQQGQNVIYTVSFLKLNNRPFLLPRNILTEPREIGKINPLIEQS